MKNKTISQFTICSILAVTGLFTLSPDPASAESSSEGKMMMMTKGEMAGNYRDMMSQHNRMMADLKVQDEALARQVAKMNNAQGDQKISRMAAVLTLMARQRAATHVMMEKMHSQMMDQMMEHMRTGKSPILMAK